MVLSSNGAALRRVCVVGGGTAGFYVTQYLVKHLENCRVDILEKLPVPFGLVRFGVAPDHPEVKNVINTFTKTASHPAVQFLGNVALGKDFSLRDLRENYNAVVLSYGAESDRSLGIPVQEGFTRMLSARQFVAWYNGYPGAENVVTREHLTGRNAAIIGQGNVAVDVARILLAPVDQLRKTDITDYALDVLASSRVENVAMIGRRGPLQAAFTIKELREMLKLPGCGTKWRPEDFVGIPEAVKTLERPRKRLTELMLDSLSKQKDLEASGKTFSPIFFRSPREIRSEGGNYLLDLTVNELQGDKAVATEDKESLQTDLLLASIGYSSLKEDSSINFDGKKGVICNENGRVLRENAREVDPGLYVSGWLATGPTGVILTTMNNAFSVGQTICDDFGGKRIPEETKPGLNLQQKNVVSWSGWEKIDQEEVKRGSKVGKPREKIVNIEEMLKIGLK
ncbi:NADPH:adrenodoxin oxidoreductase, mitochondrial [Phlebotomus argentipes]|uniref:NADPH:adrenodoxin oxidoreductase, mitochondrial n=1 Tax=Phlebotomus argentipes TaxID=94469 RepID=UPI0028934694|nr:NADPH:adrenodoxin oxidoreductase, mitochondrial [Phlebotomus argentipes]